ncbi:MAG: nitrile hydratase accessory protein [Paracoccaceae bacterium]
MRPEPAFQAPWHAQLFALTVHLHEAGHFTWPDWAAAFSATLKRHGADKDLNGGDDYFAAWLEALESKLRDLGLANDAQIEALRAAWETAYLTTPHGDPVKLAR